MSLSIYKDTLGYAKVFAIKKTWQYKGRTNGIPGISSQISN